MYYNMTDIAKLRLLIKNVIVEEKLKLHIKEKLNSFRNNRNLLTEFTLPPGFSYADFSELPTPDDTLDNIVDIDEGIDDLGAKMRTWDPEDMTAYLARSKRVPALYKGGENKDKPRFNKKGEPLTTTTKTTDDRFKYPYLHPSSVIDESGNLIDLDVLRNMIIVRPDVLLKQNSKMEKSSGEDMLFFDISLPALKGLVVDETTNEFKIVDTCPNAGACKIYCYARKGGYVQWKDSWLAQTKVLNFLLNDYKGFTLKLMSELQSKLMVGKKVVLRWHDSGDFISKKYLEICYDIARKTPNVIHYFYTKNISMTLKSNPPSNVVFNFSYDSQEKDLIKPEHKKSITVPYPMFTDLMKKNKELKRMDFKSKEDELIFKRRMSARYDIPFDSILTYKEMLSVPYDPAFSGPGVYNVIVVTGDGDVSALRRDVLNTYLLRH